MGDVGPLEQRGGIEAVIRRNAYSNARSDLDMPVPIEERFGKRVEDVVADRGCCGSVVDMRHGEGIGLAADAGCNAVATCELRNPVGRFAEQQIGALLAQRLVELAEPVDLDDEYAGLSLETRPRWLDEAIFAISNEPIELIQPIMHKLNEIWQQRSRLSVENPERPSAFELEILKLKTAIHFARHVNDDVKENPN